ncbi:MAG: helicase-related protein [Methylococcaceae bacterium]
MRANLPPITGCLVRHAVTQEQTGQVLQSSSTGDGEPKAQVQWFTNHKKEWIPVSRLMSGLKTGMYVQDTPRSHVRKTLGQGYVRAMNVLGGSELALVEFPASGARLWLPIENLKPISTYKSCLAKNQFGPAGNAENFRLRTLAHGLQQWNENTGALSKLDIDPLPHQIHLVHHILKSGNLNWLIADDVGLGKTIEVGMLLSALMLKKTFKRVLLITPAGLVNNWKEELHHKFGLSNFRIYGTDFMINEPRDWNHYDQVIASVDLLKLDTHKLKLMHAGDWNLVVFDEAHRLGRARYGAKLKTNDRYQLAVTLRKRAESILLLSATPHQGNNHKFAALLELIRPEWRKQIADLSLNPDILNKMVFRNNKAKVTDANGRLIFAGKVTHAIDIPRSQEEQHFDQLLRAYLANGYNAGVNAQPKTRTAIGFVMTVYRKLAASSIAAIEQALSRRVQKLQDTHLTRLSMVSPGEQEDSPYEGEWEESVSTGEGHEFFNGEMTALTGLIAAARTLLKTDQKMLAFLDNIISGILNSNPNEKVLIFSEYRGTQNYIAEALRQRYRAESVDLIHGGMNHQEREQAIAHFEDEGQFLISTEAGGEGINLHKQCHVMVNFDLPWNPMRLVQRVGRLYRYGQKIPVVVFNIHSRQTLDADIMNTLYARISSVVKDLSPMGGDFCDQLGDDIVGQMADMMDIESILKDAISGQGAQLDYEIKTALERAEQSRTQQMELFKHFASFDPEETRDEFKLRSEHLVSFVDGMMKKLGIELIEKHHQGSTWDIRLPDAVQADLYMGTRQRLKITFDRELAIRRSELQMMDFNSPLLLYMIQTAKKYSFDGRVAALRDISGSALSTALLRWQNDQGERMREEFIAAMIMDNGRAVANPPEFLDWLLRPAEDGSVSDMNITRADSIMKASDTVFDHRLAELCNQDLHPENREWISVGCV